MTSRKPSSMPKSTTTQTIQRRTSGVVCTPELRTRSTNTKEVPPMMLCDLIDQTSKAADRGLELPCRVNDPELWFAERPEDVELAKTMCRECPLRQECLAGAKDRREPWGVWGGELFMQGVVIARKRPRGRPRKQREAA
ncbi:WhiB family transcriptional regulator [Leekyejoonella antrihumi]